MSSLFARDCIENVGFFKIKKKHQIIFNLEQKKEKHPIFMSYI